jgi:hypothetical protein
MDLASRKMVRNLRQFERVMKVREPVQIEQLKPQLPMRDSLSHMIVVNATCTCYLPSLHLRVSSGILASFMIA